MPSSPAVLALAAVTLAALTAPLASAPSARAAEPTARYRLLVVHASSLDESARPSDGETPPPSIAPLLERHFEGYARFVLRATHTMRLAPDEAMQKPLPGGGSVGLAHRGLERGFLRAELELGDRRIAAPLRRGGWFFASSASADDGLVVLALTGDPAAEPTPDDEAPTPDDEVSEKAR